MGITHPTDLAAHLRALREARGLTLAAVAEQSGVSRATLSRIETGETSPTAETLGRLSTVYLLPISQLLTPLEPGFRPLLRNSEQTIWHDPDHDFTRRVLSPANGQLTLELITCTLGPQQTITYTAPSLPGQEHHLHLLSGQLNLVIEGEAHQLEPGDSLRYFLHGASTFSTRKLSCTYLIALK